MGSRLLSTLLFLSAWLLPAPGLRAEWEIRKVADEVPSRSIRIEGDTVAYQRREALFLFRISTGQGQALPGNVEDAARFPVALEGGLLWYWAWAYRPGDPTVYRLFRYDLVTGESVEVFSTEGEPDMSKADAEGGRLVVYLDHDWWLFDGDETARLTYSGPQVPKQDPVLAGDHLLWRDCADEGPEVHLTTVSSRASHPLTADRVEHTSLCASGDRAAWVKLNPVLYGGGYRVVTCLLETGDTRVVGATETSVDGQLCLAPPWLFWVKHEGETWSIERFQLEDGREETLYATRLPIEQVHVAAGRLLFLTRNCVPPNGSCTELNALDIATGRHRQLTCFGRKSYVEAPRLGRQGFLAFGRYDENPFPLAHELFVGVDRPISFCGAVVPAGGSPAPGVYLVLLALPLLLARRLRGRLR